MNGFIFDMDGVLLDSIHIWLDAEQKVLDDAGIQLTKEQRDTVNAFTLAEAGAWFHDTFDIMGSGEQVVGEIMDYMLAFYDTRVKPKPGAVEFVRAVHEVGVPLCVLSSSPQKFIQAGLGRARLKQFFDPDLLISAEDAGWKKRDPKTFHLVCEKLGTRLADTWLFDDSWYALATAQQVGVRGVGIFSMDDCGTHDELARYCEVVADDFSSLNPDDFIGRI